MNSNDECFLRYDELKRLLYRAYTDFFIVQGINEKSLSIRDRNRQFTPILSHICILATQDMALTIWKVSIDNDGKANTFKQLKTFLHQKLHLNVSEIKNSKIALRNYVKDFWHITMPIKAKSVIFGLSWNL